MFYFFFSGLSLSFPCVWRCVVAARFARFARIQLITLEPIFIRFAKQIITNDVFTKEKHETGNNNISNSAHQNSIQHFSVLKIYCLMKTQCN